MPKDAYIYGQPAPAIFEFLSACLSNVGRSGFNQSYLALTDAMIGADQCMIFAYHDDRANCYLSYNKRPHGNARALADKYLQAGYKDDPLREHIRNLRGNDGTDVIPFALISIKMAPSYRRIFFDIPGIVDKLTLIARRGPLCLGINFYRYVESGPFTMQVGRETSAFWDVIGQVALLHYSDLHPIELTSPLMSLSEREREICEYMLKGLTTDAIAWELNLAPSTVTTYRKRAYAKLSINSKSALFAVCGRAN